MTKQINPGLKQEPGYGRISDSKVYIGIVKNNIDLQGMGRLEVYIPDIGGDPEDSDKWYIVSYASPFAGTTSIKSTVKDGTTLESTQTSYGFWAVPPDLENLVLVVFVNGEASRGVWFGCLFQQNMNHMVPGVASNLSYQEGFQGVMPPVAEYNKNNQSTNLANPQRPRFDPLHEGLTSQGLYTDFERGPSSSSARRLADDQGPAQVYGMSTPRSNSFCMDDDPDNEFIRIRTRGGTQVLVHETNGYVYINSGKGNSWIEVSDDGVDIYSKGNVSLRSEQDINFHADKNINMTAGQSVNVLAGSDIKQQAGGTNSQKSATTKIESSGSMDLKSGASLKAGGSTLDLAASGAFKQSGGTISQKAAGSITRDGMISDNGGGSADAAQAGSADAVKTVNQVDANRSVKTTVSRMPTHEPWAGHPKSKNTTPPRGDTPQDEPVTGSGSSGKSYETKTVSEKPQVIQKSGEGGKLVELNKYNGPSVKVGNRKVPSAVEAAISKASSITGVDYGFMMAMADKESSFNPYAKAPTSSAKGLYQFLDATWNHMVQKYGAKHGITDKDRFEAEGTAILAGYFTLENRAIIAKKTGKSVSQINSTALYIGHFLGAGGAAKLLNAQQTTPAYEVVGDGPANANANVFFVKGDRSKPRTAQEVIDFFAGFIEPKSTAYAAARPTTGIA